MNPRSSIRYAAIVLLFCACLLQAGAGAEDAQPINGETVIYADHQLIEYPMDKLDSCYTVPEGVTHINVTPFWNLHLRQLSIPASCIEIALCASEGSSLEAIDVDERNSVYASIDGVVYDKRQTTLLLYPPARRCELFIVPSTVEAIDADAFSNCRGIRYLLIPEQVLDIGGFAFDGSGIREVIFCGYETDFGIDAFNFCPKLEKIWVHPGSNAEKRLLTETDYIDLTPFIRYW